MSVGALSSFSRKESRKNINSNKSKIEQSSVGKTTN